MGTSLTAGTGDNGAGGLPFGSFVPELGNYFTGRASHVRTYNIGSGGAITTQGISTALPIVQKLRPSVVVIEYMMNNSLGAGSGGLSTTDTTTDYNTIIAALKALPSPPTIFLTTMNPVVGASASAVARANVGTYNALLPGIATANSVSTIVPVWGSPTLTDIPDGVHPTLVFNKAILIPAIVSAISSLIT